MQEAFAAAYAANHDRNDNETVLGTVVQGEFELDELTAAFAAAEDGEEIAALNVTYHEIHRVDSVEGNPAMNDSIISTLKYFQLHVTLQGVGGKTVTSRDGTEVLASLVYDDITPVEELSATFEPPLIGGRAALDEGVATFRLRVTVLTSLCYKRNFRVKVWAPSSPELDVAVTNPFKTITKLRRGVREKADKAAAAQAEAEAMETADNTPALNHIPLSPSPPRTAIKRGADAITVSATADAFGVEEAGRTGGSAGAAAAAARGLDKMWEAVQLNGQRLMELQAQQKSLYDELQALRAMRARHEAIGAGVASDVAPVPVPVGEEAA